jgi:DNA helicase-2/ATP-dependent DNA helicase PcrA
VDEYQDTNPIQYRLVRLLAGERMNLCVVGDDDQSIYRWRGADIRNILDFEKDFPGVMVVKLEQNYRSTQTILTAAGKVVEKNRGRKGKTLWTENPAGDRIVHRRLDTEREEARFVSREIESYLNKGCPCRHCRFLPDQRPVPRAGRRTDGSGSLLPHGGRDAFL